MAQHIIVNPLSNKTTNLSVQRVSLFIGSIFRFYSIKDWLIKNLNIEHIGHFLLSNGILNAIQSNYSTYTGFYFLSKNTNTANVRCDINLLDKPGKTTKSICDKIIRKKIIKY